MAQELKKIKKKKLQESFTGVEKKKEKSVSPTKKMVIIGLVIEERKKERIASRFMF